MIKIGISGHRDLTNISDAKEQMGLFFDYLKNRDTELAALTSLAVGADTLFAEVAESKGIPLHIFLPFEVQEFKNDFSKKEVKILESLLLKNDYKVVSALKGNDQEARNEAYLLGGKAIVDQCDIFLAVWDGKPAAGKGGTGDIVAYALANGKELHIINGERTASDADTVQEDNIHATFNALDSDAKKYKNRRFERAWFGGIVSGLLAVFCFAIALTLPCSEELKLYLSFGEALFLTISFVLLTFFAKKWKKIFLDKRRGAEYLRMLLWYKDSGIPIPTLAEVDYSPGKTILAIEKQLITTLPKVDNLSNAKRISWSLAQEQIAYHSKRVASFHIKNERIEKGLALVKYFFLSNVGLILLVEVILHSASQHDKVPGRTIHSVLEEVLPFLKFFWVVLPPIYAAFEGVKYFSEWKRNIVISNKTITALEEIKKKILKCNTESDFEIVSKELRNTLEIENSDWAIRYDEKEMEAKL